MTRQWQRAHSRLVLRGLTAGDDTLIPFFATPSCASCSGAQAQSPGAIHRFGLRRQVYSLAQSGWWVHLFITGSCSTTLPILNLGQMLMRQERTNKRTYPMMGPPPQSEHQRKGMNPRTRRQHPSLPLLFFSEIERLSSNPSTDTVACHRDDSELTQLRHQPGETFPHSSRRGVNRPRDSGIGIGCHIIQQIEGVVRLQLRTGHLD